MTAKTKAGKIDYSILGVVIALLVFGLMMISSAGVVISKTRYGDEYHLFKRQLFYGVLPGLTFLLLATKIHFSKWKKYARVLFPIAVILLVMVFIPGVGDKRLGASRWIEFGPISFQPTELAKLALIVYLASWIERVGSGIRKWKEGLLPFAIIVGAVSFLVILQPDVGTLGSIAIISLAMFFVAGARFRHIAVILGVGLIMLLMLIKIEPYRMNRFIVFMDPKTDPQGIGYQINQALIAVGSGGSFGLGLGQSRQKFNYLPEPVNDSIFAIIGEELGLLGAGALVIAFIYLGIRGYRVARNAPDRFSMSVAVGVTTWILFQALINIMAIIALIPLTGVTLPLVSYGASSLVFVLTGVGILLNISKYSRVE